MPTTDEMGIFYFLLALSFGLGMLTGFVVAHLVARNTAKEEAEHKKTLKAMREGGSR